MNPAKIDFEDHADDELLETLLAATPEKQIRFLLHNSLEMQRLFERLPERIAEAVERQRSKDLRIVAALAIGSATIISAITPLVIFALS